MGIVFVPCTQKLVGRLMRCLGALLVCVLVSCSSSDRASVDASRDSARDTIVDTTSTCSPPGSWCIQVNVSNPQCADPKLVYFWHSNGDVNTAPDRQGGLVATLPASMPCGVNHPTVHFAEANLDLRLTVNAFFDWYDCDAALTLSTVDGGTSGCNIVVGCRQFHE